MRTGRDYLFGKYHLGAALQNRQKAVQDFVDKIPEQDFRGTSDDELREILRAEFTIRKIALRLEKQTAETERVELDWADDYGRRTRQGDRGYPGTRVTVSIPFVGDPSLWNVQPSHSSSVHPHGRIEADGQHGGVLRFTIEQREGAPAENVKAEYDRNLKDIQFYLDSQEKEIEPANQKTDGLADTAIAKRRERSNQHDNIGAVLGIPTLPRREAERRLSQPAVALPRPPRRTPQPEQICDLFISHASENKAEFVRPLADALVAAGLTVWYDDFTLKIGDSLLRKIDQGLARSRYGIVVLSPQFFEKSWPMRELDGLAAKETGGEKVILPIWHGLGAEDVRKFSPTLAGRLAINSSKGIDAIVKAILDVVRG